jgi:hypothetical protein
MGAVSVLLCTTAWSGGAVGAESPTLVCGGMARAQRAAFGAHRPTGSEFVRQIAALSDDERESAILEQALRGNFPTFLSRSEPVRLTGRAGDGTAVTITLCVAPDYFAIGSDTDYLYVPMRLKTAITVANHYDSLLPTRRIVDAIYAQAQVHLAPQPLPAGDTMRTTGYYWHHSELVREQRASFDAPMGALTAGDKKDLVLTNRSWNYLERVAIYGWHRPGGAAIQPLSTVHGARYADYSHGVRLVSAVAYVNGVARSLLQLLQDPRLARVVSDEGMIRNAGELLRTLQSPVLGSARGDSGSPHEIKEIPVIGEAQETRGQLGTAALPIDLTHAFNEMLHE